MEVRDYAENYGTGWIKIYRSIRDHWIFENEKYLKAWLIMILEMNHTEKKSLIEGELVICKRGEKIYSISTWCKIFGNGWSRQKVRTFFNLLEKDKMIQQKGMQKTTSITILNYDTYQSGITNKQPTDNQQITNGQPQLKNDKNVKNEKKKDLPQKLTFSDDVISLAKQFKETLPEKMWPTKSVSQKWLDSLDKCIRIDNYTFEQISELIEAFRNDGFWKSNFLSPVKFRERNKDGIKYIDFFWNKLESMPNEGLTDEEIAIREHNKKVFKMWGIDDTKQA